MHHLGAVLRKLVHLFERGAIDDVRGRNAARIGGHRAAHVGVDVDAIRAERVTDRDRRKIGAAAAERRDRAVFARALKAGDHRNRRRVRAASITACGSTRRILASPCASSVTMPACAPVIACASTFIARSSSAKTAAAINSPHASSRSALRAAGVAADQAEQRVGRIRRGRAAHRRNDRDRRVAGFARVANPRERDLALLARRNRRAAELQHRDARQSRSSS